MDRLDTLRAFCRIVEKGSFRAVAAELGVGQSTVSKWLRDLEEEVGARLLDRTTRALHVTEAGAAFYPRAVALLSAYDDAVVGAREESAALRGRIRVSLPEVFGRLHLLPLLADFLERHPGVELQLVFADHYVDLVEGGFDVAVRVGVQLDSSLTSHGLGQSARRLVASPGYVRCHGTPAVPADLTKHPCLVHTRPEGRATWHLGAEGAVEEVHVTGRVAANNSEATRALARRGLGIALLAAWLVDEDIAQGRLVRLLEDHPPSPAPVRALTPPGRHLPRRVRALLEHLREGLRPVLGGSNPAP